MSSDIDVTLSALGPPWTATVDACVGVAPCTGSDATPALALEGARSAMQTAVVAYAAAQGTPLSATQLAALELRLRLATGKALFLFNNPPPTQGTPPLFGVDVSTFPDLDPLFAPMTPQRAVAEAVARRLITPNGSVLYDKNFGFDLRDAVGRPFTTAQIGALQSSIEAEAEKDERVQSASAVVTFSAAQQSLTASLSLRTAAGPFALVLTVSALAVNLQVLKTAA